MITPLYFTNFYKAVVLLLGKLNKKHTSNKIK